MITRHSDYVDGIGWVESESEPAANDGCIGALILIGVVLISTLFFLGGLFFYLGGL